MNKLWLAVLLTASSALASYEPTLGDVGLHWTGQSQEMMYSHHTGAKLDQPDAWGLALYLRYVVEPGAIAAAANVPSCASTVPKMEAAQAVTTDKFLKDYVLRPLLSGGCYPVHGNYEWDLMHNMYLEPLQACMLHGGTPGAAWLKAHGDWMQALDLQVTPTGKIVKGDPTYIPLAACNQKDDGATCANVGGQGPFDMTTGGLCAKGKTPDPLLSVESCRALKAANDAHDGKGGSVQELLLAFKATARTPRERMFFTMRFTGARNLAWTSEAKQSLEDQTHVTFNAWADAFGCSRGMPPDVQEIIIQLFNHNDRHNLLAEPPGANLRTLCPATTKRSGRSAVVNCPWIL